MKVAFVTDRQCGRGHVSRADAIREVLIERGHTVVGALDAADMIVVDHYGANWGELVTLGVQLVHVYDTGMGHPAAATWNPIGHNALVRRAFREAKWQKGHRTPFDVRGVSGLTASQMATAMAHAGWVVTPPSVTAWEALAVGAPIELLPPAHENQRRAYDAILAGETLHVGMGAVYLVDTMEALCARS